MGRLADTATKYHGFYTMASSIRKAQKHSIPPTRSSHDCFSVVKQILQIYFFFPPVAITVSTVSVVDPSFLIFSMHSVCCIM